MQERYSKNWGRNTISKYRIILSNKAISELEEIYRYISYSLLEPKIADKLRYKILNDILRLEHSPHSCMKISIGFRNKAYRRLVSGRYIILYRINEQQRLIKIYHIYFGRRNYFKLL